MEEHLDFVLEGGSIESDGKGTVFTTSQCLLAPNRNQPLSKEGIEDYLKRVLCAERIVWLDHGNLIGDDTDGHIDTIVRIAPDDTILYVKCDDYKDEQFQDFEALESQLQCLRTKEGKPYRLLPLPMPKAMYDDGDRLPATYANFLIINGAVLVPTYNQPELDKKAMEIIQQAFPDREIVGIDCNDTAEKWAAAVKKHNLPWLQVRSEDGITEDKFRIKGYPYKVLISPEGIVLNAYLGETADFYQYLDTAL